MNAWESPGSGNRRSKGSPRCCGRTGARQLPALRRIRGTGALRRWNDGRDVGNLGEAVWHYQRHDRRSMGHSRGSKGPRGQYGVCLACVWRVSGITGGRGWHDQREGAPPINVDAPETKASQFASAVRPLSGPGGPQPNCKQYFDSVCLCPAPCGRVISPERDLLGTPAGPQAREGVEVTKYSIGNACGAPKY